MVCICNHIGESLCVRGWFQSQLSALSTVSTEQGKSEKGTQLHKPISLKTQIQIQRTRVRGCRQAQLVPKLRPEKKAGGRKECHRHCHRRGTDTESAAAKQTGGTECLVQVKSAVCGHRVTTATVCATCIRDILQVQICSGTMIYCHHIFLSIMANGRRLRTNTNTT